MDETGFSFQARPALTWARQLSTIASLSMNGRICKRHHREAIRGPQVVRMLRYLRSCIGRPLMVI